MTKAKEKAAPAIDTSFTFGSDALKTGFEKSAAFASSVQEFSKDSGEAYLESAMIAGAGMQSISSELYAYSQKAASDSIEAAKAAMTIKSLPELFALQAKFAKSAFDNYVAQTAKVGELYTSVAKKSYAPLEARAQAIGDIVSDSVRA